VPFRRGPGLSMVRPSLAWWKFDVIH
jgi:hypothetical protein